MSEETLWKYDMINKNPSEENHHKIHESIDRTVVIRSEQSHIRKQLFRLAREVRTIVGFDRQIEDKYKKVVKTWKLKSGVFLEDESLDILWAQFKTSWNKIQYSTDAEFFVKLVQIAVNSEYPPICENYDDIAKELIRLCAVLDAHWSPEPFYLSCRMAATYFGYSHSKMAKLLELLVLDGVLELVEQGKLIGNTGQKGRASRYRFLSEKGKIDLSSIETNGESNKDVL